MDVLEAVSAKKDRTSLSWGPARLANGFARHGTARNFGGNARLLGERQTRRGGERESEVLDRHESGVERSEHSFEGG